MATFILPHACMELGLTHLRTGELEEANVWFEKAKRDYSGYLLEMMVHFRVHCGQRVLKQLQRKRAQQKPIEAGNGSATVASSLSSSCNVSVDGSSDASSTEALCSTPIETSSAPQQGKRPLATTSLQRSDAKPTFSEQIEPVSTQL
jgi:hypothetical protein